MAKRVTTITCRIQDDFVDFSFNIYTCIYIYLEIPFLLGLMDNLIKNGISRAKQERQKISQEPSKTDQRNLIPFVTTYNPRNPDVFPVIQTNLPILGKDKMMGDILANAKIIKSNRQPKNLKQILTKAKFEDDTRDEAPKVLKCKNTKCGIWENIIEGESFTFKNGPTFKVRLINRNYNNNK